MCQHYFVECIPACVCVCVKGCVCVCLWGLWCQLVAAAGLKMCALGNHKTQSLWSIPEPHAIIYSILLIHPQPLSILLSLFFFSSLYLPSLLCLCHSSSLSSISHSHTHSISVFCYISLLSVVCVSAFWTFFLVISLSPPCSITRCPPPRASHSPSLTLPTSPAVLHLSPPPHPTTSPLYPCCPPPLLPFFFCLPSHVCARRRRRGSIDCTLGWQAQ